MSKTPFGIPDNAPDLTAAIAVEIKPVAWLKTWTTGSDHCQRVELHPRVEPWLAECNPTITPLFASPQPLLDAPMVKALEPFGWWLSDNASEAYITFERDEHKRRTRMAMLRGNWTETPLYALSALQSDGDGK